MHKIKKIYPTAFKQFLTDIKLTEEQVLGLNNTYLLSVMILYLYKNGIQLLIQDSCVYVLHNNKANITKCTVTSFTDVPLSGENIRISFIKTFCSTNNYYEDVLMVFEYLLHIIEYPIVEDKPIEIRNVTESFNTNSEDLPF